MLKPCARFTGFKPSGRSSSSLCFPEPLVDSAQDIVVQNYPVKTIPSYKVVMVYVDLEHYIGTLCLSLFGQSMPFQNKLTLKCTQKKIIHGPICYIYLYIFLTVPASNVLLGK